jgi:hypothetical protein
MTEFFNGIRQLPPFKLKSLLQPRPPPRPPLAP